MNYEMRGHGGYPATPAPEVIRSALTPHPGLQVMFENYSREHAEPNGVDLRRLEIVSRNVCSFWGKDRDPQTLRRADIGAYHQHRLGQGVKNPTVRREFAFLKAAINHEIRWERCTLRPVITMPPAGTPRRRFLTDEEQKRVMLQPMPYRIRLFFLLAFGTAARARAIEQLTWDRVDFVNGMIDYRLPGIDHKKKRRAIVPMSAELHRRLESAFNRPSRDRSDPYVIGLGPNGACSCTYEPCKAVLRAAGIDEAGVARHVCRKTFASRALQSGVKVQHVAAVLGDSMHMVERHYGFLLPEHLRQAVNFRDPAWEERP